MEHFVSTFFSKFGLVMSVVDTKYVNWHGVSTYAMLHTRRLWAYCSLVKLNFSANIATCLLAILTRICTLEVLPLANFSLTDSRLWLRLLCRPIHEHDELRLCTT